MLDLPEHDVDLYAWARRSAPLFDRGPRGALLHATSRQAFHGRGESAGVSDTGRLRDYRAARSAMRGNASLVFRFREIAPERQASTILDLRSTDGLARDTRRLLSVGVAAATLAAAVPNAEVSWAAFGADREIRAVDLSASPAARFLRGAAQSMLNFAPDPQSSSLAKQSGRLRRAVAYKPDAHVILVSHYIEPELVASLPLPFGATVFLVEGAATGWRNPRGGDTLMGGFPVGLTGEDNIALRRAVAALNSPRVRCYGVRTGVGVLEALTEALKGEAA